MKNHLILLLLWTTALLGSCTEKKNNRFQEIYNSLNENNYFGAQELYELHSENLSPAYRLFTEAMLFNAFNKPALSEQCINALIKKNNLPDSLMLTLHETKYDNAVKLYNYADAKNAANVILETFHEYLDEEEAADYKNTIKIWTALENVSPMKVNITDKTVLKMKKDLAGLNTLPVSAGTDSLFFIFDTGANLSTTTQSVARQLNMEIIPVDIEVGTITGTKVGTQLAVCTKLSMGNITWSDVVFLVMPDEALAFPQINYQIYGILGFPVIESLNEIRISQDGQFTVSEENMPFSGKQNLAMNGLTPLIRIDNKHFTFDTGADNTMLYNAFFTENKDVIEKQYELQEISFGGAGGSTGFEGYKIDYSFMIGDREIKLKDIHCLKEKIKEDETGYGNIGQDLIQQFDLMILNFDKMFVDFK